MRTQFIRAPGEDFVSISLPAGEARGIVIDNPSGSWLHVYPTYDYIAPYTIGWSRPLPGRMASVTIRAEDGPAGQLSTTEGDDVTIYLDSDIVPSSPGVVDQFVNRSKQPELLSAINIGGFAVQDAQSWFVPDLAAAPVPDGARIRLFETRLLGIAPRRPVLGIRVVGNFITATGVEVVSVMAINANKPLDVVRFNPPLDGPIVAPLQIGRLRFDAIPLAAVLPTVAAQSIQIAITYSVL